MKKGFTLVELLAVIVILAIIAIITIPMISNVIEKSKLGAMEDSAYGLIEAANYYYAEHMNEMSSNKLFVIENGIQTSEEKLNYKGKIEGNAKVLLASNGKVALCLTNGKSYAKKEITDSKVVMNTVSSDTTCEINGIDSDSDITIDISGSNSSYYNKNEIDDKLNDLKIEIAKGNEDLSKLQTNEKGSLVGAINEVNSNSNIRYNVDKDIVEILVNGEWQKWRSGGFSWNGFLYQTGNLYQDITGGYTGVHITNGGNAGFSSSSNLVLNGTRNWNGGTHIMCFYSLKSIDLTLYKKLKSSMSINSYGHTSTGYYDWGAGSVSVYLALFKNVPNNLSSMVDQAEYLKLIGTFSYSAGETRTNSGNYEMDITGAEGEFYVGAIVVTNRNGSNTTLTVSSMNVEAID